MLELVQQLQEKNVEHGLIEFILSPGEEIGLIGANALDMDLVQADFGFVLDNGGAVGSITMASPTLYGIEVVISGLTAHAGLEPEKGVSAIEIAAKGIATMKLGRIDAETTANIGRINGGTASNIVADEVIITAEARSMSYEACQTQVQHMLDCFTEAATERGGAVTSTVELKSKGYGLTKDSKTVKLATTAIEKMGLAARYEVSGGGSDANIFNAKGKEAANLSIGYEKIHTVHELLPINELEKAVALALQLVREVNRSTS